MNYRRPAQALSTRIITAMVLMFILGFSCLLLYLPESTQQLRRVVAHAEARALVVGYSAEQNINSLPQQYRGEILTYSLYSPSGELLQISNNLQSPRRLRPDVVSDRPLWPSFNDIGYVINIPVKLADGSTLMVAKRDDLGRQQINQVFSALLNNSMALLMVLLILCAGLMWYLLRWTLAPVERAAMAASELDLQHPEPMATQGLPIEILPLVDAANQAIDRLSKAYQSTQRFTADAAHQLRTPLAVMQLSLNRSEIDNQQAELGHRALLQMSGLVDQLLQLAKLEARESQHSIQQIDLIRLCREVLAQQWGLFEQAGRALTLDCQLSDCRCQVDEPQLRQALHNTLENALQHGQGDTLVRIQREINSMIIDICDQGCSPEEATQERLFERFYQAREGGKGSGLGLAIVRQTLENAGGKVHFCNTQKTCLRLQLPLVN